MDVIIQELFTVSTSLLIMSEANSIKVRCVMFVFVYSLIYDTFKIMCFKLWDPLVTNVNNSERVAPLLTGNVYMPSK